MLRLVSVDKRGESGVLPLNSPKICTQMNSHVKLKGQNSCQRITCCTSYIWVTSFLKLFFFLSISLCVECAKTQTSSYHLLLKTFYINNILWDEVTHTGKIHKIWTEAIVKSKWVMKWKSKRKTCRVMWSLWRICESVCAFFFSYQVSVCSTHTLFSKLCTSVLDTMQWVII